MATTATQAAGESDRPSAIVWAVVLNAINAIGGVVFAIVWPDLDERATILVVSAVLAALFVVVSWFLWNAARWAGIATVVLNAFNILLAVPAFFEDLDAAIVVATIVAMAMSAITIALVLTAPARAFWNNRAA